MLEADTTFFTPKLIRLKRKKTQFYYEHVDEVETDPKNHFKINFYFSILDVTFTSLRERYQLVEEHANHFSFLYNISALKNIAKNKLRKHCILRTDCIIG